MGRASIYLVFLVVPALVAVNIDWLKEAEGLLEAFTDEFDDGRIEDAVHDTFTEDFLFMRGPIAIEADFNALLNIYSKIYAQEGRFVDSNLKVVTSCGNFAVTLHRFTIDVGMEVLSTGTTVHLLEYAHGEAKAKLTIATP